MKTFIISVCTACTVLGALHIICPGGNIGKSVKYVFSLVFLLIIISSAAVMFKTEKIQFNIPEVSQTTTEEMQVSAAKYVYESILKKAGIEFTKITVCTDKLENDSIVINKVIIYSTCEKEKIIKALGVVAENHEVEIINE